VVLAGDMLDDGEMRRVIIIPEENIIKWNIVRAHAARRTTRK
jgi:hypothetical protein